MLDIHTVNRARSHLPHVKWPFLHLWPPWTSLCWSLYLTVHCSQRSQEGSVSSGPRWEHLPQTENCSGENWSLLHIMFLEGAHYFHFYAWCVQDPPSWKMRTQLLFFPSPTHTHRCAHTRKLPILSSQYFPKEQYLVKTLLCLFHSIHIWATHRVFFKCESWRTSEMKSYLLWAVEVRVKEFCSLDTCSDTSSADRAQTPPIPSQSLLVTLHRCFPLVITFQMAAPNRVKYFLSNASSLLGAKPEKVSVIECGPPGWKVNKLFRMVKAEY